MKLTPMQAEIKIRKHLDKGEGIYVDSRYFNVRVQDGYRLQLWTDNFWFDIKPNSEFRNGHGRTLFVYEPIDPAPLTIEELCQAAKDLVDMSKLMSYKGHNFYAKETVGGRVCVSVDGHKTSKANAQKLLDSLK